MSDSKKKKTEKRTNFGKINKSINVSDKTFNDIIDTIDGDVSGTSSDRDGVLTQMGDEVNRLAFSELDKLTVDTGSEKFSDFIKTTYNKAGVTLPNNINIEDLFKADNSDVLRLYNERYKSQAYLYDDIEMILQQFPELKEAVSTTRDAIVNSESSTKTMSKEIYFVGNIKDADKNNIIKEIEKLEAEYKLERRVRNETVEPTLEYGDYYTYLISYSEIIDRYEYMKANGYNYSSNHINSMESNLFTLDDAKEMDYLTETFNVDMNYVSESRQDVLNGNVSCKVTNMPLKNMPKDNGKPYYNTSKYSMTNQDFVNSMNHFLSGYEVYNDSAPLPVIENAEEIDVFKKMVDNDRLTKLSLQSLKHSKNNNADYSLKNSATIDGTIDMTTSRRRNKDDDNSNIVFKKVYIKNISPKQFIPIRIMNDCVIGYYWIKENINSKVKTNPSMTFGLNPSFSNTLFNKERDSQDLEKQIVVNLVDKIVKAFDKKYLEDNMEFKEMIISALLYDDLYRKNITFQFVPADFVVHHKIKETEDGRGTSMLIDSLFNAKLYLSLKLFKHMTIISKSNDQRIYTIKSSYDNQDIANNVQRTIREIKKNQMSYLSLMNYNALVSDYGANKSLFLQGGASGESPITFDILAGQQVELHTELMEDLKKSAVISTGVPNVMLEYFDQADYAKSLEMAHIKFANFVCNLQMDLNDTLTEMYQKLLKYATGLDDDLIRCVRFKFTPPKATATISSSEQMDNSDRLTESMVTKMTEVLSAAGMPEDLVNVIKNQKSLELTKYFNPGLPWDMIDDLESAELEAKAMIMKAKILNDNNEMDTGEEGGEDEGFGDEEGDIGGDEDLGDTGEGEDMGDEPQEEIPGEEDNTEEENPEDETTDYTDTDNL